MRPELVFGFGALLAAFLLNADDLVEGGDELLVRVAHGVDIDDAALVFLRDGDGAGLEGIGVFLQQRVREDR